MNILFTICGRAGSKGIKNKNLRMFCGKPLAYYSLSAIDLYLKNNEKPGNYTIVVNSDSDELLELMAANPMLKIETIRRREELCGDTVAKKDVILDCIDQMEERTGCRYDAVVDLDITSPLRTVEDVASLINKHFETNCEKKSIF